MSRKHLTRRDFLRLSTVATTAAVLAACTPATVKETVVVEKVVKETVVVEKMVTAVPAVLEPATLNIWINWGGVWQEAIEQLVAGFSARNPQIDVELLPAQTGAEGKTKFMASIAAGNPPDLMTCHSTDGRNFTHRDILLSLNDYMANSTVKADDFFEAQLAQYMMDDNIYGIPSIEGAAGQGLVWNKAHFEEAGLDPEVGPKTHQEVEEFAKKLDQYDSAGNITRLGFDPRDARGTNFVAWWFETKWYDPDTGKLNLYTPDMVWGADWVANFAKRVGPENMTSFRQEYGTWTGNLKSGFVRGAQSMIDTGYYVAGELYKLAPELEFGVTWPPRLDGKKITTMYGWFWVMPKGCPNPDAAWKYIEHATSVESAFTLLNVAGGYPSYKPFLEAADFSKIPGMQWFVDTPYECDETYIAPPLPIAGNEVKDRLNAGLDAITFGQTTADEMLSRVQDECQKLIDQELGRS